jgi:hypothetical protein
MDIDAEPVHVLDSALNVLALESRGVDAAFELLVVKVSHAAVWIGRLQYHRSIQTTQLL